MNASTRTHRTLGSLGAVVLSAGLGLVPMTALADAPYAPPAADAQATALFKLGREKKTNYAKDKDSKFKVARGEIFINAPMKDVKAVVMDYGSYSTFISKFQKSKILKTTGEVNEVYLQAPILHGAATIWAVESFAAPAPDGKGEKIVGSMLKGNVDDLRATWRMRPVDDKHTVLSLDMYIAPKIAAPESLVTAEAEDACGDGVISVKERAEAAAKTVASKN